jgi:His/Glu/Gln/Arg/opine family amino acid ABC transporter permease subunit
MPILEEWWTFWSEGLSRGFFVTVTTTAIVTVLTIVWSLVVVAARVSPIRLLSGIAKAYIELIRGTPLIVQLFGFFFVPSALGFHVAPWPTAIFVLTLHHGPYLAEHYRSGYLAIPQGQREAGLALGMGSITTWRRVLLPQLLRVVIPAIGNVMVFVLLASPFTAVIGTRDMLFEAERIQARTHAFSVFVLVTLVYVVLGLGLAWLNHRIERRLRLP